MDPAGIVEDTEQTWFCPQMDRQTDGGMDRQKDKVNPVYPLQLRWSEGYNTICIGKAIDYHWIHTFLQFKIG